MSVRLEPLPNNSFAQSISEPEQISQQPNILSTSIAVNPTNPSQIAMNTTIATESDCQPLKCDMHGVLYTTLNGGKTWQEQVGKDKVLSNSVYVNSIGEVYSFGTLYDIYRVESFDDVRSFLNMYDPQSPLKYTPSSNLVLPKSITPIAVTTNSKINISYLAYAIHNESFTEADILLEKRTEGKLFKTTNVAHLMFHSTSDNRVLGTPTEIQVILGNDKTLSVFWGIYEEPYNQPTFIATSTDGGETFTEPQKLPLDIPGYFFDLAFSNGDYYLIAQQKIDEKFDLALLKSRDFGKTWESYPLRNVPQQEGFDTTVGIHIFNLSMDISKSGVIDVAYTLSDLKGCFDDKGEVSNDPNCHYDVFYMYSTDNGKTFSEPEKINPAPISQSEFVKSLSLSSPSISIASTDQEALISWVGTKEGQGTQAYLTRVKR